MPTVPITFGDTDADYPVGSFVRDSVFQKPEKISLIVRNQEILPPNYRYTIANGKMIVQDDFAKGDTLIIITE